MMSFAIRIAAAFALAFAVAAALSQDAAAASIKRHHPVKTHPTAKPAEQYLRSASPDPGHAPR